MNSSRNRTLAAWLAVAALSVCAFFKTNHYPLYDNALFEYAGRAILRDQHLYAYVWDNKLPPIYYLSALYQQLFGERYALHLIAQLAINLGSIWLFARIAQELALASWRAATLAFAALLLLPPPQFNQVEYPALLLILAAYFAWLRHRAIFAGLLLALATTFWIPAVLLIVPIVLDARPAGERLRALAASSIALIACLAVFISGFGLATMREIFASWGAYGTQATTPGEIWSNFYRGALLSGGGLAIAAAATLARKPQSSAERFILIWAIAALAGAAATLRFYPHYFAVAPAPLVLYVFVASGEWKGTLRRSAAIALAIFLVWKSAVAIARDTSHHMARAQSVVAAAKHIQAEVAPPRYVELKGYEPGIYLAADIPLRSRYEIAFYPNQRFLQNHDLNATLAKRVVSIPQ